MSEQQVHSPDCWREHHACAVQEVQRISREYQALEARVEAAEAQVAALREALEEADEYALHLPSCEAVLRREFPVPIEMEHCTCYVGRLAAALSGTALKLDPPPRIDQVYADAVERHSGTAPTVGRERLPDLCPHCGKDCHAWRAVKDRELLRKALKEGGDA